MNNDPNLDLCSNIYLNYYNDFQEEFDLSCNYYSESSSISNLKQMSKDDFIAISINIQSYLAKRTEFLNMIDNYVSNSISPSIINIQETWFDSTTNFNLLTINNYKWHSRPRTTRGGGVASLVHNIFSSEELFEDLFLDNIFESLILKLSHGNFTCISVNLYRPPRDINNINSDSIENSPGIVQFFDRFSELLNRLDSFSCPIFLSGDFNLNLFSCTIKTSNSCKLIEHLIFSGFLNLTYKATRISQNSHTLIDLFAAKNCLTNIQCNQVIVSDLSDHFIILFSFSTNNKFKKPKPSPFFSKRLINETNINNLKEALRLNNWDEVHGHTDVNVAYSIFITKFLELFNHHCPLKEMKFNKKFMPQQSHMSPFLLNCRSFKQHLFRLKKANKTYENEQRYKRYRNQYNRAVRTAKINDYHDKIRSAGKDSKKIWNCIKEIIGQKKEQNQIEFVEVNGDKVYGSRNIADSFNKYFSSIAEQLTPNIPTSNYSFRDFLPPPNANSIFVEPLYPVAVFNLIKSLKPKKSLDNDGISMYLLNQLAEGICAPLSSIYNLSIETSTFPDKLKISKTIIIHKSGSLSLMDHFRGVSLIPSLSKPLEKHIFNTMYSFLDNNSYFSCRQFGFRPKYSTIHNALDLYNLVTETLAAGQSCLSIFVDIQKCFDMVDREILLAKFENCGIRGRLLLWFRSYFTNRQQRVFFNNVFSSTFEFISIGILQGSILGVIAFLVMVNDLVSAVPPAIADLFADDSQLFLRASNLNQLIEITNNCLPRIIGWYNANKLIINSKKTKVLIYSTPLQRYSPEEQLIKDNPPLLVDLNNLNESFPDKISKICPIPNDNEKFIKHLGLLIDDTLSFHHHFNNLYNKLNRSIFTLKQMKNILNCRHLKLLYDSYIRSHLEYGIILFSAATQNMINPIVKLQKICVRIIEKTNDFRAHSAPLFKKHKILPFPQLLDYNCLIFMHRYKQGKCPEIFNNKWTFQAENHNYFTRNRTNFAPMSHNRNYIFNAPLYYLPRKFNQLPINLKSIINEKEFSRKVFNYLLNSIAI